MTMTAIWNDLDAAWDDPQVTWDGSGLNVICTFTPPTIAWTRTLPDAPPLANRLMRFYSPQRQGRQIWELLDGTLTFSQPYPTFTPEQAAGAPGTNNNVAATYRRDFLGGHVYVIDETTESELRTFLAAEGYDPDDWIACVAVTHGGYFDGYQYGYAP